MRRRYPAPSAAIRAWDASSSRLALALAAAAQNNILNLVVLCGHYGLHEVAATWQQVVDLNAWQPHRISALALLRLFGTVTGKRIALLGFAYGLRPTSSTRRTPTTPVRPPPFASAAICSRKAPSWRSLIPR